MQWQITHDEGKWSPVISEISENGFCQSKRSKRIELSRKDQVKPTSKKSNFKNRWEKIKYIKRKSTKIAEIDRAKKWIVLLNIKKLYLLQIC
jgi:hypothetical protein